MTLTPIFTKEEWLTMTPEEKEAVYLERKSKRNSLPNGRKELAKAIDELIAQAN